MTTSRSATRADLAALTALQQQVDVHWFGSIEHDEVEIAEAFELLDSPHEGSRLVFDGTRLIGAAQSWRADTNLLVAPDVDARPLHDELLSWLATAGAAPVDALDRDATLIAALERHGWHYLHSAFDLVRTVADDWHLPEPRWPAGVQPRDPGAADAAALHELIYDRAGYAAVAGHPHRGFAEWQQIFLAGRSGAEQPVVAWRGGRMVGTAIGRLFSDGTGWINQLAVDRAEQGRGIGRALLLETFRRRRTAGATTLGLSVQAGNRGALRLYLDVGLRIDREWRSFASPAAA